MTIKRTPKPWASQKIFFDVVVLSRDGQIVEKKAMFLCKGCRHVNEWSEESDAFRCVRCGRKLTAFGANEILTRYEEQLQELKKQLSRHASIRRKDK